MFILIPSGVAFPRAKGWIRMREFSWKYFALTGDVESYLLYKAMEEQQDSINTDAIGIQDDDEEIPLEDGQL